MTFSNESFCPITGSAITDKSVSTKILWELGMLHQRDEKGMTQDEFFFPKPLRSMQLHSALNSDMFTSKYRGATGAHEASDSG